MIDLALGQQQERKAVLILSNTYLRLSRVRLGTRSFLEKKGYAPAGTVCGTWLPRKRRPKPPLVWQCFQASGLEVYRCLFAAF